MNELQPIATAPKDGTYIVLFGPGGYRSTLLRCQVCRYDEEYRPLQPWKTYSGGSFMDDGAGPTHWMPLPEIPKRVLLHEGTYMSIYSDQGALEGGCSDGSGYVGSIDTNELRDIYEVLKGHFES